MPKHSSPHLLRKWVGDLLLAFQILSGAFCWILHWSHHYRMIWPLTIAVGEEYLCVADIFHSVTSILGNTLTLNFFSPYLSDKVCNETQEFHRLFCHGRGQEISSFMVSPIATMREAAKILRRTLKVLNYLSSLQKIIILVFH